MNSQAVYSSRRIAKAVREQLPFLCLSGGQQPDFRTLNTFRSSQNEGVIDELSAVSRRMNAAERAAYCTVCMTCIQSQSCAWRGKKNGVLTPHNLPPCAGSPV